MSKNSIVNVTKDNIMKHKEIFKADLADAVVNDGLDIKEGNVYLKSSKCTYKIDKDLFSFLALPIFNMIFKQGLESLLDEINENTIFKAYIILNPFFEGLSLKFDDRESFIKKIQEISKNDFIKELVKEFAENEKDIIKKREIINRFISVGVLTEKDKVVLGYYIDCSNEEIIKMHEEGIINDDEQFEIISQKFALEMKKKKNGKSKYNYKIVNLLKMMNPYLIIGLFVYDKINLKELIETKMISKNDLLNSRIEFLFLYLSKQDKSFPEELTITSKDLIRIYGINIKGKDILKLVKDGYIESQDFIDIFEVNKLLKIIEYDEDLLEDSEILDYYNSDKLLEMKKSGKISLEFIEKYLIVFDFKNNPELFEEKSNDLVSKIMEKIIDDSSEKDIKSAHDEILYFLRIGFCSADTAKKYITNNEIDNRYLNNEFKDEDIIEFYNLGLLNDEAITKYYEDDELLEMYENKKIGTNILYLIRDNNLLIQGLCDNKISIEDFLNLYLKYDKLSVEELNEGLVLSDSELDISSFIDGNTSFEKIKELALNYLIDYSSLLVMKSQGIISDEQFLKIKNSLDIKSLFKEIKAGKKYCLYSSREKKDKIERAKGYSRGEKQIEEDFSDEINLISTLLNKDVLKSNYGTIESYNSTGNPTSLNGYRIFCNEELSDVVILQKSKKGNAVYVLSAYQMSYFLNGKENENGEIEVKDKMKDKAYLRTLEGVKVVEHSKNFARNLLEATASISTEIALKIKKDDETYLEQVQKIVDEMIEKYKNAKELR